ncbi:MAG: rRNA maturation RNase YbeY [Rhodospirillales bacterium]|nr:rRNA maturation RNase YbeY [Rhodospirillales bacterium]
MARTTFNRVQADLDFSGHAASGVELAMRLTTDRELQTLNLQFRGLDKPTNVLSFAALDGQESPFPDAAPLYLGDIAIAAETVAGEARDQQKSVVDHLAHMVVHGTLHLLGYDHEDAGEAEEMEALEREILKRHGIDDPYQDQEMAK